MRRKPSVAGYFYPQKPRSLQSMIERLVDPEAEKEKAVSIISPHAGYEYSGKVAGSVFSSVILPKKYVIIGPSHSDAPTNLALMKTGVWETPLGDVHVDTAMAELILENSIHVREDERSHLREHSIEVQLPFIQYFMRDITIVPVSIAYQSSYQELEDLGQAVSQSIRESGQNVMIVASTDMSHYVSQEVAEKKDFYAIEKILELDAKGLYEVVNRENISMCGFQPATAAIMASKALGAKKAKLIRYQTSGDVSGNFQEVVGYAGIRIT